MAPRAVTQRPRRGNLPHRRSLCHRRALQHGQGGVGRASGRPWGVQPRHRRQRDPISNAAPTLAFWGAYVAGARERDGRLPGNGPRDGRLPGKGPRPDRVGPMAGDTT